MTARKGTLRALLLGVPLTAALVYAAFNWFRFEDETIFVGAAPAAREDPFLAYSRLLDRMGTGMQRARVPSALDELPARGTLVISARRLAYMTPERVRRITAWVERGATLVVEAEREGIDDPLLDALGVQRVFPERADNPRPSRIPPDAESSSSGGGVSVFDWPRLGKPLRARIGTPRGALRDTRVRSQVHELRQRDRVIALAFAAGEGEAVVLPTLRFLRNNEIGDLDHAELGWRLVSARSPVVLYLRMRSPPLLEWIQRDAWPVALAAALLLLLWLARIIPRFGPLEPDPPPVRRSLLEHVVASGRFLWSRGAGAYLLDAVRERAWRAARRRGVSLQAAGADTAIGAVAQLAGMSAARARTAFTGTPRDAPAFVEAAATLQQVEERLGRRDTGGDPRNEGRRT